MEFYSYDPITKEFIGKGAAQEDPLESLIQEKPVYLLPAHATFIECPPSQKGYAWCFDERKSQWFRYPDFRGKKVYLLSDASEVEIIQLGNIPFQHTDLVPSVPFPKWNGTQWETDQAKKSEYEKEETARELSKTDSGMARAAEDLIAVLVNKGVIGTSDLPTALLSKIEKREGLRQKLAGY
jgi:hypothetical protein